MKRKFSEKCFPSARDGAAASELNVISPQTQSASYKLAFADPELLLRDELRAVRLQLELMKPELIMQEAGVEATVVIFGGSRIPDRETAGRRLREAELTAEQEPSSPLAARRVTCARNVLAKTSYYDEARKLARLISEDCRQEGGCGFVVATGGGPGIMEAANRGAQEAGGKSIGLNIVLPHEQAPNSFISPDLCFQFHYFALRKMHFLMRARALVVFPGGFGTMDELFETLTLIQTKKIKPLPVLLFGKEFWDKAIQFEFLLEEGVVSSEDLQIFRYIETAEDAWHYIREFYNDADRT